MDETSETIRQQIDETKLQLAEKLESLEQQVSDTVQSTGTAMTATAEAVQETVQTLSSAIRHAVDSVTNALDVRRQIERHPWLVIGGCVALGYVAADMLTRKPKMTEPQPTTIPPTAPSTIAATPVSSQQPAAAAVTASAVTSAYKSGQDNSSWHQMRDIAIGILIGVVQDVATRSVPQIVDYLTSVPGTGPAPRADGPNQRRSPPRRKWPPDVENRLRVASSGSSPINANATRQF